MKQGLIHIYCGNGKGKTTAATGLAVRAAGCGMKVLFSRFLKNEHSGELKVLDAISGIEVMHLEKAFGFYHTLNEVEKKQAIDMYETLWYQITEKVQANAYQMLVIDEFMAAFNYGLINHEKAIQFLKQKPRDLEVVLTGRNPSRELLDLGDYVSEIQKIKHPYDQDIKARRGIEF